MKSILDSKFQYKPSFATDLRKTFDRVRKQQRNDAKPKIEATKPGVYRLNLKGKAA